MRGEPFAVDSYVHVVKRGARGMPIVGDVSDRNRFLRVLYHMNDEYINHEWDNFVHTDPFYRPDTWPERKPLVMVLAFTLMPNHVHLLLKEIREGGISKFMQKSCQSMSNHHNKKYQEKGSIFQGPYRARVVDDDMYFRYVSAYIMVKNVFELFPQGGLAGATAHFENAWNWSITYPFSSLGAYATGSEFPIIEKELLGEVFLNPAEFKRFARDVILGGRWLDKDFLA